MRILIAIVLIVHGLAHTVGFVTPWRIGPGRNTPYRTTVLSGAVDLGDTGIRVMGILWLVAALTFVLAGVGAFATFPWWRTVTLYAAIFSLILSILGWPDSRIGVFINIAILAYLGFGTPQR